MWNSFLLLAMVFNLIHAPKSSGQNYLYLHLNGDISGISTNAAFDDKAKFGFDSSPAGDNALPVRSDTGQTGLGIVGGIEQTEDAAIGFSAMSFSAANTRAANILGGAGNPDFNRRYANFTVSLWYKPNSDNDANSSGNWIVGKMGGVNDRGWQLFRSDDSSQMTFTYFDATNGTSQVIAAATGGPTADRFTHIAVTYSKTNAVRMYFDGIEVASQTTGVLSYLNGINSKPLQIGNRGDNSSDSADGMLDDVGLWMQTLDARRIAAIHALGRFENQDLQSREIDNLLVAFAAQGIEMINGHCWEHTTGLSGVIGATGGSVSGSDAYVVLDGSGNGMRMKPVSLLLHLDGDACGSGISAAFEDKAAFDNEASPLKDNALPVNSDSGDTGLGIVGGVGQTSDSAIGQTAMSFVKTRTRAADIANSSPDFNCSYSDFTVALWYKPDTDSDADPNGNYLIGKMGGTGNRGWQLSRSDDSPQITFTYFDGPSGNSQSITATAGGPSMNKFTHIAVTFEGGQALRMYFDGVQVAAVTNAVLSVLNGANSFPLQIGNRGDNSTDSAGGIIDDLGVWNAALSPQQIALIHAAGRFENVDLQDEGINHLLNAYGCGGNSYEIGKEIALINGHNWQYATDLAGGIGAIGGSVSNSDAYVVLDSGGNGVQMLPPVFEGAMGFGINTPAGTGGQVIKVTNLNRSGAGSLVAALAAKGPRIIVFEVGGIIDFEGLSYKIIEPYVTIAGQTAPSPGITIIKGGLQIWTHDVLMQHIRIRAGDANGVKDPWDIDAMGMVNAHHIVIDHCSFSWGIDGTLDVSGPSNQGPDGTSRWITLSHNIVAETLSDSLHSKGVPHSRASLIHDYCNSIALVRNIYAHNDLRSPDLKPATSGVIVNNLIYDPGGRAIHTHGAVSEGGATNAPEWAVVGNLLRCGPSTGLEWLPGYVFQAFVHGELGQGIESAMFYLDGNDSDGRPLVTGTVVQVSSAPIWPDGLAVMNSADVYDELTAYAGARPADRDAVDLRIIQQIESRSGSIINSQNDVGGYPSAIPAYRALTVPPPGQIPAWLQQMADEVEGK